MTAGADPVRVFGAVDIGASGGRVMAGLVTAAGGKDRQPRLELEEVHRFPNGARESGAHLRWDLTGLYEQVLVGLTRLARRHPQTESIGIDTWAVDYAALDRDGRLLAEPICYRDQRTAPVVDWVHERLSSSQLYAINGLQYLPFNTVYQLAAERRGALWPRIATVVLLPDLLAYWLTGELRTEITNASTTGLLDAERRSLSSTITEALGLPAGLLPPLVEPGQPVGAVRPEVADRTGLAPGTRVVAVGSHDTASAVVGVPAAGRDFGYVSSGTWSLVGVELDRPVLTERARRANFTNEGGVDGRIRFLRNVGGLWLLQESIRTWREAGQHAGLDSLLAAAAALPPGGPVVDVDSGEFHPPGDMPARIRRACSDRGQPPPETPEAVVRCVLDSLAVAYARTIAQARDLTGVDPRVVHIVGGGSRNDLLCQLTADLCGLPVVAGPVEATALGNLVIQARTAGAVHGDLERLRDIVRRSSALRHYRPSPAGRQALSSAAR